MGFFSDGHSSSYLLHRTGFNIYEKTRVGVAPWVKLHASV